MALTDGTSIAQEKDEIFGESKWGINLFINDLLCYDQENIKETHKVKLAGTTFNNRQEILEFIHDHYSEQGIIDPFTVEYYPKKIITVKGLVQQSIDPSFISPHIYLTIGRNSSYPQAVEVHATLIEKDPASIGLSRGDTNGHNLRTIISSRDHRDGSLGVLPKNIEQKIAEYLQAGMVGNFGVSITKITRDEWPKMPGVRDNFYIPYLKFDEYNVPPMETELQKFIEEELAQNTDTKKKVFRRKNK